MLNVSSQSWEAIETKEEIPSAGICVAWCLVTDLSDRSMRAMGFFLAVQDLSARTLACSTILRSSWSLSFTSAYKPYNVVESLANSVNLNTWFDCLARAEITTSDRTQISSWWKPKELGTDESGLLERVESKTLSDFNVQLNKSCFTPFNSLPRSVMNNLTSKQIDRAECESTLGHAFDSTRRSPWWENVHQSCEREGTIMY